MLSRLVLLKSVLLVEIFERIRNTLVFCYFHSNVRSLLPKVLDQYFFLYDTLMLAFCESGHENSVPSSFFCSPGYACFRRDRFNKRGSGSLILVKNAVATAALDVYPYTDIQYTKYAVY